MPTSRSTSAPADEARARIDALLSNAARATGSDAAQLYRQAAREVLKQAAPLRAARLYELAAQQVAEAANVARDQRARRLAAELELELGLLYEKELGLWDQAMRAYERAFKRDPDFPPAIEAGRRVYYTLGDFAQVARLFEIELETLHPDAPREKRAELEEGLARVQAEKLNDFGGAIERLERVVEVRPNDAALKEYLASLYLRKQAAESSQLVVAHGARLRDKGIERAVALFVELASECESAKDVEREILFLRRAVGADAACVEAAERLERALIRAGRRSDLRRLYRQELPLADQARKRAELALTDGDLDEAVAEALQAANQGVEIDTLANRICSALDARKSFTAAAELLCALARIAERKSAPDLSHRTGLLARATELFVRARSFVAAERTVRAALKSDPMHSGAFALAVTLLSERRGLPALGEIMEARAALDPALLAELADFYDKKLGDVAAALRTFAKMGERGGSQKVRADAEFARLQQKLDRWKLLETNLERELEATNAPSERAEVLRKLSQLDRDRHQFAKAKERLEQALGLRPDEPLYHRALADIEEREDHPEKLAYVLRRQLGATADRVEKLNLLRRLAGLYDERLEDLSGTIWASEEILLHLPGDRDALRRLESAYERSGPESEQALIATLEAHLQAAATPTERVPLSLRLGALHENRGALDEAIEQFEHVLKWDRGNALAEESLARVLLASEKFTEAAALLDLIVERETREKSDRQSAHLRSLGDLAERRLGDLPRAERAYRALLELRPGDRQGQEALARIAQERGDQRLLAWLLAQKERTASTSELGPLLLERANLIAETDREEAIATLEKMIATVEPASVPAHAALLTLQCQTGDVEKSQRTAERMLFLLRSPDEQIALALEIARTWQEAKQPKRAIAAFERVLKLEPSSKVALDQLAHLYALERDWERLIAVDEARLPVYEQEPIAEQVALLLELGITLEQKLHDATRGFVYFRRAHELARTPDAPSSLAERTLSELRRIVQASGQRDLWSSLAEIYAGEAGLSALLERAEMLEAQLGDPDRAFAVLIDAFSSARLTEDPQGTRILPELERLVDRVRDPAPLLSVYERLGTVRSDNRSRVALLRSAAKLREQRLSDPQGALDSLLGAFKLDSSDANVQNELRRLGQATGRLAEVLAAEWVRMERATPAERFAIALELATAAETLLGDRVLAFQGHVRAYALRPRSAKDDVALKRELWRLARSFGPIEAATPATSSPIATISPDDDDDGMIMKPMPEQRTEEIDLNQVIIEDKAKPPPWFRAWAELEKAILSLPPAEGDEIDVARAQRFFDAAEMWEFGAGDVRRALSTLGDAFRLDPDRLEIRKALDQLVARMGADGPDRLVALFDSVLDTTQSGERAIRLLLESAAIRLGSAPPGSTDSSRLGDAEARYRRVLSMRPDCEPALEALESILRETDRLSELATLLERRMGGLLERMAPGSDRQARAIALAEIYERQGSPYEALTAWSRVAEETPDHAPAFVALARLYEQVGKWSKVVETLVCELDLIGGKEPDGQLQTRAIRKRIGQIFEVELQLPERAIEAYEKAHFGHEGGAVFEDQEAEAALARLYESVGRYSDLERLLRGRARRTSDLEIRRALLEQSAALLMDRLADDAAALDVLIELKALAPDDLGTLERLSRLYAKMGMGAERVKIYRERIALHERSSAPELRASLTQLYVELGVALAEAGQREGSACAFEAALSIEPNAPSALAELARLREGGADWHGFAQAKERQAAAISDDTKAAQLLVEAARVHIEKREDDASALPLLERALDRNPDLPPALSALAGIWRRSGDDARADALAEHELTLSGSSAPPPLRKAELYATLGGSRLRAAARLPSRESELVLSAQAAFEAALAEVPAFSPAVDGLADLAARFHKWDEMERLLRAATGAVDLPPKVAAHFFHRLAEACEAQGRTDDAYSALLAADRLTPVDLRTRLLLGENRYRVHRYRDAAQILGALSDHPDASRFPEEAAAGIYHAALAELKLRRVDRASALLESVVSLVPGHLEARELLAETALSSGQLERAVEHLEQQAAHTLERQTRTDRFIRLGELVATELGNPGRALTAFERAVESAGEDASASLLERTRDLEQHAGRIDRASELAERLIHLPTTPVELACRLRVSATLEAELGRKDVAKARLRSALEHDPLDHETLDALSALLVEGGADDEEAAQLLTRTLPRLPTAPPALRAGRGRLWTRLGEARERLKDLRGSTTALEKALELDPGRRELREKVLARYGNDPAYDVEARAHRLKILDADPLHAPSLRAMAAIERRRNASDGGERFFHLLEIADALEHADRTRWSELPKPADRAIATLDESTHTELGHPEAVRLAEVFAVLWEGTAAELTTKDVSQSAGVTLGNRVSPVAEGALSRAYGRAARALGNRKTGLFMAEPGALAELTILAQPPTAVVVARTFESRPFDELCFLLGRALELARPEYVLASSHKPREFARLFSAILRAFHPRYTRRALSDDENTEETLRWKRTLPYKVAKRLAELFANLKDAEFSSATWRRAVQHTGNRAGLLVSSLPTAARVLAAEGDRQALEELARFATSDIYLKLKSL